MTLNCLPGIGAAPASSRVEDSVRQCTPTPCPRSAQRLHPRHDASEQWNRCIGRRVPEQLHPHQRQLGRGRLWEARLAGRTAPCRRGRRPGRPQPPPPPGPPRRAAGLREEPHPRFDSREAARMAWAPPTTRFSSLMPAIPADDSAGVRTRHHGAGLCHEPPVW